MKLCPICKMQVDAENECPICGASLTYEKEIYEEEERLIFNKYLLIYLLKLCWFPLLVFAAVNVMFIKKPLEQKWLILVLAAGALVIWVLFALFNRRAVKKLKQKYPILNNESFINRVKNVIAWIVEIALILILLAIVLPLTVTLIGSAFVFFPGLAAAVIALIAAVYVGHLLKLLFQRRKFLQKLEKFCKSAGCKLELYGRPVANALVYTNAGARMIYPDRTVELYFIGCPRRGVPVFLGENGSASFYHRIGLGGVTVFDWFHEWKFCEELKNGSYILLLPASRWVYTDSKKAEYAAQRPERYSAVNVRAMLFARFRPPTDVDNATRIGKATVYTGGAFLRYMERMRFSSASAR